MKNLLLLVCFAIFIFANSLGFVDNITINGREFDSLDDTAIEFYSDDLIDGKITVSGILESDDGNTPVDQLSVEISTDGGESWHKASGHEEWEWSFTPELGRSYNFAIRVVKNNTQPVPSTAPSSLPSSLTIAGFTLSLDSNSSFSNGKVSGGGTITIPYLKNISSDFSSNDIHVNFSNLSFSETSVTSGNIIYTHSFTIPTPIADINVNSLTFSPNPSENKIVGNIAFKGMLATSLGTIDLPNNNNSFSPSSISLSIPIQSKNINIWEEQNVKLEITSGSLNIGYSSGDGLSAHFDIPSLKFNLGNLLKYTDTGNAASVDTSFSSNINITLPKETALLDTGIKLPSGTSITLNIHDYNNPILSFSSSVNLENYSVEFLKNLSSATISAQVNKTGLNATITGNGSISPITILDRGSEENSVRVTFEGNNPTISIEVGNSSSPTFNVSGITPKLHFGNLLKNATNGDSDVVANLEDLTSRIQTISISKPLKLLNSNIKLPSGFSATINLEDLSSPSISFSTTVDFSMYDNIVAKHITSATIQASISSAGFNATVTAAKPSPIDIYSEKDVKLIFEGDSGPSFSININGSSTIPDFHISSINAKVDFGTLLRDIADESNNLLADVTTTTVDGSEVLNFTLPKAKLPGSSFALEGTIANLNLQDKRISLTSTVDLSGYGDNPILQAITGSTINATVSPSGFSGSVTLNGSLEPIDLWAEKNVKLIINGTPSIGISLGGSGVNFDFGALNASVEFGDLLKDLSNNSVTANLSSSQNSSGEYTLSIPGNIKLLDSSVKLNNTTIGLNIRNKTLSLSSSVDLSDYNSAVLNAFNGASLSASVSTSGFTGSITKSGGLPPIDIYAEKNVQLIFSESPTITLTASNSGVKFDIDGGSANIDFGTLLSGVNSTLSGVEGEKGVYTWQINGEFPLGDTPAKVKSISNGRLDIKDITNPKVSFDANIDLSGYGGIFSNISNAELSNTTISKSGFSTTISANLGTVNIWQDKNVKLTFTDHPTLNFSIDSGGPHFGFSNLAASIDFGDLLPPNSIANITNSDQSGNSSFSSDSYTWSLDGRKKLFGKDIYISSLSGTIDLSDFSDPSITLSAMVDFSQYDNPVFSNITNAQLENVTISKHGFSGTISTTLSDITIWPEKGVKVVFDQQHPPTFNMSIDSSGLKFGAENLTANIDMGTLLNNSTASLQSAGNHVYEWSINGENNLGNSGIKLSGLHGNIDFSSLKDLVVNINGTADLSSISTKFHEVILENGTISKDGFSADISTKLDDISIYKEGSKEIMLKFASNKTPTLHISLNREDGFDMGVSDLQADFKFTNILNNQLVHLSPVIINGEKQKGKFSWQVDGNQSFLNDSKGQLYVNNIGGIIDLSDWKNPGVSFHTTADFTNYNLIPNVNLGTVEVTNAIINKTKIEWNLEISGASANFTILDLGDGPNDDVRLALENISASLGSEGASFGGGDGTLYLGKLFDGNKHASLTSNSSGGLKSYTFSFSEDLVYRQDDDNFITFKNLSGTVTEQSSGKYKVSLEGEAIVHSSILNAVNVGQLSLSNLEIDNTGFKGTLTASWNNKRINILDGKAALILSDIGITVDTSKTMPVSLSNFGGKIDLASFFEGNNPQANLSFADSSIKWNLGNKELNLKGSPKYIFNNLNGTINFASSNSLSLGFSGVFRYKDLDSNLSLNNFVIDSSGITGSVTLGGSVAIIPDLQLTQFNINFAGINTTGSATMVYSSNSFLNSGSPFSLSLSATADKSGLKEFSLNSSGANTPQSINISNFAILNFTNISVNPDLKNFWISLDGTAKPQNSKFSSNVSVDFTGLKISKSGVTVVNAGATKNISGADAKLGPLSVSVTKVGIGFDKTNGNARFYLNFAGSLSVKIAQADADITIYSDKKIKVNKIAVDIHQSGLKAKGSLDWYSDDPIYGDGFKATIEKVYIADIVETSGLLQIGQKGETFYWQAALEGSLGPSGIPLGTSGLSMFTAGGGIAYNMSFDSSSKKFIPSQGSMGVILSTNLGTTSDNGLLWNGDIKITASISNGSLQTLAMNGTSWILSKTRNERPDKRKIIANITYASNPKSLQVYANANVEYKLIKVVGQMDIFVSSFEKHIFIGTDSDYAYKFNITNDLGHINVTVFKRNMEGFFMADEDSLALGAGLIIDKTWKKKWPGPDPKLKLKFSAEAKALVVYKPTFQLNSDINLELALSACYGGCLTASTDVLLKLATPNPEYIWAQATISFPKKDIKFSKYIYGHGELQESNDEPDIDLLDHIEPSEQPISRMPIFKVYTSFMKSQPVTIQITNVKLLKDSNQNSSSSSSWADEAKEAANNLTSSGSTNQSIPLNAYNLDADDPRQGLIYLPTAMLDKHTWYKLKGQITMSYEEDGTTNTLTRSFYKRFKTKNNDSMEFKDFINSITPLNNEKNVHEDEGVKVHYNKTLLSMLSGGVNNNYVKDYSIELYDSDYNRIYGTFTQATSSNNFIAKFKPNRDLRIYRYCVNQEGVIMETFLDSEGHFLNPFNGYTVDVGGTSSAQNRYLKNTNTETANFQHNLPGSSNSPHIFLQNSQSTSSPSILPSNINIQTASLGNSKDKVSVNIPSFIKKGPVTLKSAEALGAFVMSSRDSQGKIYSYYRANKYHIAIRYLPTNEFVYSSSFEVRYNNVPAEAQRKVIQMQENLDPTITVRFDVHRITTYSSNSTNNSRRDSSKSSDSKTDSNSINNLQNSIHSTNSNPFSQPEGSFYNEVRLVVDDGLDNIEVYSGIITKIIIDWNIVKKDGTSQTIHQIWNKNSNKIFLPGVVIGYSAKIKYISQINGSTILELPVRLISGPPFNSVEEERKKVISYNNPIINSTDFGNIGSNDNSNDFGGSSKPILPKVKKSGKAFEIYY